MLTSANAMNERVIIEIKFSSVQVRRKKTHSGGHQHHERGGRDKPCNGGTTVSNHITYTCNVGRFNRTLRYLVGCDGGSSLPEISHTMIDALRYKMEGKNLPSDINYPNPFIPPEVFYGIG